MLKDKATLEHIRSQPHVYQLTCAVVNLLMQRLPVSVLLSMNFQLEHEVSAEISICRQRAWQVFASSNKHIGQDEWNNLHLVLDSESHEVDV